MPLPTRRAAVVCAIVVMLSPTAAKAHAILEESQPAAGSSVPSGTIALKFRYNSRIDRTRSRLTLTGPGQTGPGQARPAQTKIALPIDPDGPPDLLTSTFRATPGDYVVRWQVLAVDGHITRGDVAFSVTDH